MPLSERTGARILPVDSEHSALFQALSAGDREEVEQVILTASGGPFRTWPEDRIRQATVADALEHPTWEMGRKITIDSATLMNKALEVIEAYRLFGFGPDRIRIVVHPESVVHGAVLFRDGSMMAQLGPPDMRVAIQYAISYPRRFPSKWKRLDLVELGELHFEAPDPRRFPALKLASKVIEAGGTAGAVLSAANERAVEFFLEGGVPFGAIVELTERVLDRHEVIGSPGLADIVAQDRWAREAVGEMRNAACGMRNGDGEEHGGNGGERNGE
jgi:1-deoxy-D-xylulose-5-phosphate reductoisomerase